MRLPQSFKTAVTSTAKSLNQSFKQIGALHEGSGLVVSESNTVVHLGASFLSAGFAVYAEPKSAARTSSIALVASNKKISLAVSVYAFGKLALGKILQEAQALSSYVPQAYPRLDGSATAAFGMRSERWAAVFMQSFAGENFNELWCSQLTAPETFEENLRAFQKLSNAGKEDFSELASFLRAREAYAGLEPICSELWRAGERLDLLWAAFPLRA